MKPVALMFKTHIAGYLRTDGVYVKPHNDKRRQADLFSRAPTGGDQVIVYPYASGMSRKRDMAAAVESAAGLGTQIQELSKPAMESIADALAAGKSVFVDSGAFPAFKAAMRANRPEDARLDFDKVFAKYGALIEIIKQKVPDFSKRGNLMLVAPDVIGDQAATLELLEKYKGSVTDWLEDGFEAIIPFQKGPLKQSEVFHHVAEILGGYDFVVGIPSSAEALSAADMTELLSQPYQPDRIHILGAVSSKRMTERMAVIRDSYIDHVPGVTADANVMRSRLYELGGLKGDEKFEKIKEIVNRVTPDIWGGTKVVDLS